MIEQGDDLPQKAKQPLSGATDITLGQTIPSLMVNVSAALAAIKLNKLRFIEPPLIAWPHMAASIVANLLFVRRVFPVGMQRTCRIPIRSFEPA